MYLYAFVSSPVPPRVVEGRSAFGARRQRELGLEGPVHGPRVHLLTLDHNFHRLPRSAIPLLRESVNLGGQGRRRPRIFSTRETTIVDDKAFSKRALVRLIIVFDDRHIHRRGAG